jgi:hypothetical protein
VAAIECAGQITTISRLSALPLIFSNTQVGPGTLLPLLPYLLAPIQSDMLQWNCTTTTPISWQVNPTLDQASDELSLGQYVEVHENGSGLSLGKYMLSGLPAHQ